MLRAAVRYQGLLGKQEHVGYKTFAPDWPAVVYVMDENEGREEIETGGKEMDMRE